MLEIETVEAHAKNHHVHRYSEENKDNWHFHESWGGCVEQKCGDVNERQDSKSKHRKKEVNATELCESCKPVLLESSHCDCHQQGNDKKRQEVPDESCQPVHYDINPTDELKKLRFCYSLLDIEYDEERSDESHSKSDVKRQLESHIVASLEHHHSGFTSIS